jgi:hypothetical protein
VSPGAGAAYTALAPLQQLTSVPYATRAFSAATADTALSAQQLNGTPAGLFVQSNDPRLSGTIGQSVNTVYGTGTLVVDATVTNYPIIPGLSQTISVPTNSVLLVSTDGGIQSTGKYFFRH